jgi:hypothetical protein
MRQVGTVTPATSVRDGHGAHQRRAIGGTGRGRLDILRGVGRFVGTLGSAEHQRIAGAEAVADGVDASAAGHGVGVFLARGGDDAVQQGQNLLGRVAREPHVNQKGLGRVGDPELKALEEGQRGGGGGRLVG